MSFASDVTDKLQLGSQCYSNIPHKTYEQRMRLRRSELTNSMKSAYVIDQLLLSNPGNNYRVGAYVRLDNLGTPPLLIQVISVDESDGIQDFAIVNKPNISVQPVGYMTTTDISNDPTGSGAIFWVSVTDSPAVCCTCQDSGIYYNDFLDSRVVFTIDSINITNPGSGYFRGQIVELQVGDSQIAINIDQVSLTGGILEFSVLLMSATVNRLPINPVKHLTGNAEFSVIVM
jgi:hypothetical protein